MRFGRVRAAFSATPRFLRRRFWMMALVPGLTGIVTGLLPRFLFQPSITPVSLALSLGANVLILACFVTWMVRVHRVFRRRLIASGGRLCWRCGYDLSTLPEDGICPECGTGYLGDVLRERWAGYGGATRREISPRRDIQGEAPDPRS